MPISTTLVLKFSGTAVHRGLKLIASSFKGLATAGANAGKLILAPFAKLMAVLAPLLGFKALADLTTDSLAAAASMETLQVQFGALLKSESAATDLIAKLRKLNVESPLGLEDFAKGAKQLLGVRMTADESADALDKLSNIAMGNADNFDGLVRAFSQVRSAGRLMGQEVLQFVNAGFNPLAEISLRTGESMAILKKRMEDGKISFKEVSDAIASATGKGGLFNGMNQKIAATTEGKIQKLKDAWNQLLIAFGTPINNQLKPIMDWFGSKFGDMNDRVKKWGETVAESVKLVFNTLQNGQFMDLVKTGFMVAASAAGEKLVAALIYGGTLIGNQFRDILRSFSLGGYKAKVGNNVEMTWRDADTIARNAFNSEDHINAFKEVAERNQMVKVPMKQAQNGGAAMAMEIARNGAPGGVPFLTEIAGILKRIDQKLSPVP